jgi:hypothetical protein
MTIVILLANQRSGTGALGSALDRHPQIDYLGEVFHGDFIDQEPNYFYFQQRLINEDSAMRLPDKADARFDNYLKYLSSRSTTTYKIIDIKYSSLHHFNGYWLWPLEPPHLFNLIKRHKIKVIHLTRKNILKMIISGKLADANKIWHSSDLSEIKIKKIRLESKDLPNYINHLINERNLVEKFISSLPDVSRLEYEKLFAPSGRLSDFSTAALQPIFEVTDLEQLSSFWIKQAADNISEILDNFEEVALSLKDTPHSWMLEN